MPIGARPRSAGSGDVWGGDANWAGEAEWGGDAAWSDEAGGAEWARAHADAFSGDVGARVEWPSGDAWTGVEAAAAGCYAGGDNAGGQDVEAAGTGGKGGKSDGGKSDGGKATGKGGKGGKSDVAGGDRKRGGWLDRCQVLCLLYQQKRYAECERLVQAWYCGGKPTENMVRIAKMADVDL